MSYFLYTVFSPLQTSRIHYPIQLNPLPSTTPSTTHILHSWLESRPNPLVPPENLKILQNPIHYHPHVVQGAMLGACSRDEKVTRRTALFFFSVLEQEVVDYPHAQSKVILARLVARVFCFNPDSYPGRIHYNPVVAPQGHPHFFVKIRFSVRNDA